MEVTMKRTKLLLPLCPWPGVARELAIAFMIGAVTLFAVIEVTAVPYTWNSVSNVVNRNAQSADYAVSSVNIVGANSGLSLPPEAKWCLLYLVDMGDGLRIAGGVDGTGNVGSGFINARKDTVPKVTGLYEGQSANYPDGTVTYMVFVDTKGDGFGTYDKTTRLFTPGVDDVAIIDSVTGFDPFHAGQSLSAGFVFAFYEDPEQPTGILTSLSVIMLALQWEGAQCLSALDISAQGTNINKCAVFLLTKTNLSQSAWSTNVSYAITGSVTRVTSTNAVPNLFFKVTEKTIP